MYRLRHLCKKMSCQGNTNRKRISCLEITDTYIQQENNNSTVADEVDSGTSDKSIGKSGEAENPFCCLPSLRDPKMCFKYIKDVMKDDGK